MKNISPSSLHKKLTDGEKIQLVDVREAYEHEEFNIGGQLIPLSELISEAEKISYSLPVVFYCQKGIRSHIAIQRLQDKFGFTNLMNLTGGMEAWKKIIAPDP